ncbi:hypothetical protein AB0B94_25565, partial [Micromonospora sp. NPDC048986]|uniref:hypothetical protein n=1 Tax=Micromonospora sp. NPDC048986 TaxID=3155644 RepID=UPI0033C4F1FA
RPAAAPRASVGVWSGYAGPEARAPVPAEVIDPDKESAGWVRALPGATPTTAWRGSRGRQ